MKKTSSNTVTETLRDEFIEAFLNDDEDTDALYWLYRDIMRAALPGDGNDIEGDCDAVAVWYCGREIVVTVEGDIVDVDNDGATSYLPERVARRLGELIRDDCEFERGLNE